MHDSLRFRHTLASRILHIAHLFALGALASPLTAACGGRVIVDGEGDGAGGQGGASSSSSSSSTSPTSVVSSVSSGVPDSVICMPWPQGSPCPSKNDAYMYLTLTCSETLTGEGSRAPDGSCCYPYTFSAGGCAVGRPFLVEDRVSTAAAHRAPFADSAAGFSRGDAMPRPDLRALSLAERSALAAAWTRDALLEHASIASFARFSLELLAVGAPADLLAGAHAAAIDEIRHAELCFALASAYAGAPLAPTAFPFGGAVTVGQRLAELAASAFKEGCVGETLAALQASAQLERATDPAVRAALSTIAADEARHAELAWKTVAWALTVGGVEVRSAVEAAFTEAERALPVTHATHTTHATRDTREAELESEALAAHGLLDSRSREEAWRRAFQEVVRPAAQALLTVERLQPSPTGAHLTGLR